MSGVQLTSMVKPNTKVTITYLQTGGIEEIVIKRKTPPHWYFRSITQCLDCNATIVRTCRNYSKKPLLASDRFKINYINCCRSAITATTMFM